MTHAEGKALYLKCFPRMKEFHYGSEWIEISAEMRRVVEAESDRKAADLIEWWGCWNSKDTSLANARRIRRAWKRYRSKSA